MINSTTAKPCLLNPPPHQWQQSLVHFNPPPLPPPPPAPLPITHITLGSTLKKAGMIQPSLSAAQTSPLSHKSGSAQEHAEKSFHWLLCPPPPLLVRAQHPVPSPCCVSPPPPFLVLRAQHPVPPPPNTHRPLLHVLLVLRAQHPAPPRTPPPFQTLTAPFSTSSLSSEHMSPSSTMQASSMSGFKSTLRARWRIMRCMAAMHALESCWNTSDHNESAHYCTNTSTNMTYKLPTRSAPFAHATQLFLARKVILLCVWTCTHTQMHTHTRTDAYTHTQMHTHRCTHTHMDACTHTHTLTHASTHPYRPTHTDTRIHTPTQRKP